MKQPLSPRQQVALDAIVDFHRKHGYMPSIRDLMAATGVRSPHGIHVHLLALVRKGYIRRTLGSSRSIVLVDDGGMVTVERAGLEMAMELAREAMADGVVRILDGLLAAAKDRA